MTSTEMILAPPRNTVRPQVGTEPVAVKMARLAGTLTQAGLGGGLGKLLGFLVAAVVAAVGIAYGWTQLDPDWQRLALTYGWSCLAVVTIGRTIGMAWRLVRPTRGFRP